MFYKAIRLINIIIFIFKSEFLDVNTYLIIDSSNNAVVIDPSWSAGEVRNYILRNNLKLKLIIATHCHFDHIVGAPILEKEFNPPIAFDSREYDVIKYNYIISEGLPGGPYDVEIRCDVDLKHKDTLFIGDTELNVMHTPGHTPGSVSIYTPDKTVLFTGDTLFRDGVGRTDLPTGDFEALVNSLKKIFSSFREKTIVLPGHGLETTIGREWSENPFILAYLR